MIPVTRPIRVRTASRHVPGKAMLDLAHRPLAAPHLRSRGRNGLHRRAEDSRVSSVGPFVVDGAAPLHTHDAGSAGPQGTDARGMRVD